MCHENGPLVMTTNDMPKPIVGVISFAALATRGSVAKTPYFLETISCLALILGESQDSGQDSGWDQNGKKTTIPNESRESSWMVSRIEFRAHNGAILKAFPVSQD